LFTSHALKAPQRGAGSLGGGGKHHRALRKRFTLRVSFPGGGMIDHRPANPAGVRESEDTDQGSNGARRTRARNCENRHDDQHGERNHRRPEGHD
jgi:hypothetical protein